MKRSTTSITAWDRSASPKIRCEPSNSKNIGKTIHSKSICFHHFLFPSLIASFHSISIILFPSSSSFSPSPSPRNYWFSHIALCVRAVHAGEHPPILGAFYIKPNYPGICSHVCNGGFIVHKKYRGLGLGRFMGECYVGLAKAMVGLL